MSDLRAFLRALRRAGYTVRRTRGSHYQILDPGGRLVATAGSTPSDSRAVRNLRADIRRTMRAVR